MKLRVSWVMVTLAILLSIAWEAGAEIFLWTDERGIVHMTDQWSNVPESMRSQVSVRDSSPTPSGVVPVSEPSDNKVSSPEPRPVKPLPLHMPSGLAEIPSALPSAPSVTSPPSDSSALIPGYRPYVPRTKKPSPPFPHNVRLDPHDRNFVWVGPNRVPKDTFSYPRVSLEKQAQFRDRVRTLEQRKSEPRKASPGRPVRPEIQQLR